MWVEKPEAAGSAICFEFRSLGNQSHNVWARKVMAVEGNSNKMLLLGIKKVLDVNPFSY